MEQTQAKNVYVNRRITCKLVFYYKGSNGRYKMLLVVMVMVVLLTLRSWIKCTD